MAGVSTGADLRAQLNTLTQAGVVGDLTDGQLLQRFVAGRGGTADAAFRALVERHGPMVLRVCREVLNDPHDAQDAFQATFLVLARKAGSVRKAESVASWLHGVALRGALRSRAGAAHRRSVERRGAALRGESFVELGGGGECRPETWPELHEELARLPGRYREPVVLCYLEGLSTEAAAARLGCPRGTVLSRLSRARERLRARLVRRGLAGVPALDRLAAGAPPSAPDGLAAALADLHALRLTATGSLSAATVSTTVLTLTRGVLHAMTLAKLKTGALVLAILLATTGAGVYAVLGREGGRDKPATDLTQDTNPSRVTSPRASALSATGRPGTVTANRSDTMPNQELAAELDVARRKFANAHQLRGTGSIPQSVVDEADGQVRILEGRVEGRIQDLEEERELLEVRLLVRNAELRRATAAVEYAGAQIASMKKLNLPRIEMLKLENELQREEVGRTVSEAEVREVEVRIRQIERRLLALAPLLPGSKSKRRPPEDAPARKPEPPAAIKD